MSRQLVLAFVLLAVPGSLLVLQPATPVAARTERAAAIKIGLVESLLRDTPEPIVQLAMRPFRCYLEKQTASTGQIVPGGDPLALGRKLKEGKVQLGVFHGVEFAWALQHYSTLKPLIVAVNRNNPQHAYLIVRRDCKAKACLDLEGKAVALPRRSREHCRLFLERRCVKSDTQVAKFYAKVTTPTDGVDALDDVFEDHVQAAVVEDVVWADYLQLKPKRSGQLKTLLESEPFPCGVIAYQPGKVNPAQLKRIRKALTAAKSNRRGQEMLRMLRLTGFEPVPLNYHDSLLEIIKSYPCPAQ